MSLQCCIVLSIFCCSIIVLFFSIAVFSKCPPTHLSFSSHHNPLFYCISQLSNHSISLSCHGPFFSHNVPLYSSQRFIVSSQYYIDLSQSLPLYSITILMFCHNVSSYFLLFYHNTFVFSQILYCLYHSVPLFHCIPLQCSPALS